ncbi:predicted protein [Plenodomus lingam JN3]|uniref:Predicted protein n=1 Tax=Leptosphaeria maculans (strain JN3 / isolate v23.1.3 / race Av1-4-5-6-7-8) TaxID=985895 RepID=E4ZTM0_LEPMJ|nr:predicted protein [Plenodomus lingam JN3]CBX94876.1 predicted protein [Plenodomus lingam JN3]
MRLITQAARQEKRKTTHAVQDNQGSNQKSPDLLAWLQCESGPDRVDVGSRESDERVGE